MKIDMKVVGLAEAMAAVDRKLAADVTRAMKASTDAAKQDLRAQVKQAGLSDRLGRTWRSAVYPKGRNSMEPAGWVTSAAPKIISAFARGATIVPANGGKALAIPTDAVPRTRRGVAMSPSEVENFYNQDLEPGRTKDGKPFLYMELVGARTRRGKRGFRRVTETRLRGRRGLAAREKQMVILFWLVPRVKMPKLLDLDAAARRWSDDFTARLARPS